MAGGVDSGFGLLVNLVPVKLLKTLARLLVFLDSGLWATSPEDGDIASRVFRAGPTSYAALFKRNSSAGGL